MSSESKFNVAYIKLSTKTEGPFNRCCIWFQGCNLNCKGCCNKELQSLIPKHIVTLDKLIGIVRSAMKKYEIEGVTLSGGEPSLQRNLLGLNKKIHTLGLGIIMFSGKRKDELDKELVDSVDLLIDGPYINSLHDSSRILIGSKNKNLHFITNRYKAEESYFYNKTAVEEVTAEEYIFINGD